jgi:hypothetical protein
LDSAAGERQTQANNDFGQGHHAMVSRRTSNKGSLDLFIVNHLSYNILSLRLQDEVRQIQERTLMMLYSNKRSLAKEKKKLHDVKRLMQ